MEKLKDVFSKRIILVYLAVFIIVVILLNWFIKSLESNRNKNEVSNFNGYYKELLYLCGNKDKQLYDCCINSVTYMAAGNYQLAPGLGCQFGLKLNTFSCQGSYKWCEMVR
jgi:hypothetical protein